MDLNARVDTLLNAEPTESKLLVKSATSIETVLKKRLCTNFHMNEGIIL